ncbi:hypothetical protein [Massilia rhizosphaerae]|uniref:hypothetical protein n=1 Tax=Massilia rhizosphaerae TaxID=2784389 RepID=UPI0018DE3DCF|nr:hypothetical protein [Massilia rhizosphaerae]
MIVQKSEQWIRKCTIYWIVDEVYDVGTVADSFSICQFNEERIMKAHRDAVAAVFGLVLGVVAMAGTVLTDEYAHAAGAEARGYDALFHVVAKGEQCGANAIPAVLVAANEVNR